MIKRFNHFTWGMGEVDPDDPIKREAYIDESDHLAEAEDWGKTVEELSNDIKSRDELLRECLKFIDDGGDDPRLTPKGRGTRKKLRERIKELIDE
jgi:hypothetical protein